MRNYVIINGGTIYTMGSSVGGDAGIDIDGKFEINGGEVIALGSDMLQNPDKGMDEEFYKSYVVAKQVGLLEDTETYS